MSVTLSQTDQRERTYTMISKCVKTLIFGDSESRAYGDNLFYY